MAEEQYVSLDTIGQGAAVELFNDELSKVLKNIQDLNTKPTITRRITMTVDIKPDEDRSFGTVLIQAQSKLAPSKGVGTAIYIGMKAGSPVATERDNRQLTFDDNVVGMKKESTNAK